MLGMWPRCKSAFDTRWILSRVPVVWGPESGRGTGKYHQSTDCTKMDYALPFAAF